MFDQVAKKNFVQTELSVLLAPFKFFGWNYFKVQVATTDILLSKMNPRTVYFKVLHDQEIYSVAA